MKGVSVAVEGDTDAAVAERLLQHAGHEAGRVYVAHGKTNLTSLLAGYNNAAKYWFWFVLRDLDHDASCAPALVENLLPQVASRMVLRVAVREMEAWLLGDCERVAWFLAVPAKLIPGDPESLDHPKRALVDIARQSKRRTVREDMVPREGSTAQVGPGYTSRVIEYAHAHWRPDVAATRCGSLRRCLAALQRWPAHP